MEACAGSHYWGREFSTLGHTVHLTPRAYVNPFAKRQKNEAADAKVIYEAARRPSVRLVAFKDEEQRANGVVCHEARRGGSRQWRVPALGVTPSHDGGTSIYGSRRTVTDGDVRFRKMTRFA
jgi:hypothetical protein